MSNYQNWVHTRNPFSKALQKSFVRALMIVSSHRRRLEAYNNDPELNNVYQRFGPVARAFERNYSIWLTTLARRKRRTQEIVDKLSALTLILEDWNIRIMVQYKPSTPTYKELMRGGRTAFHRGAIDKRIAHLQAFAVLLEPYPNLADVYQEVQVFASQLEHWRTEQNQWDEKVRLLSATLSASIPILADHMFKNLGILIFLYSSDPSMIVRFFDMELIRQRRGGKSTKPRSLEEEEKEAERFLESEEGKQHEQMVEEIGKGLILDVNIDSA